ncbi:MAG: 16S rRNA (cytosine(1402)-N(4))-methyltransferase RsmH [Patescibacteria group bacterium]
MGNIQRRTGKIEKYHIPVLLKDAINGLKVVKNGLYIDATVGGGGHSREILSLGGRILGLDIDPEAISAAKDTLRCTCPVSNQKVAELTPDNLKKDTSPWLLIRGNFKDIAHIAREHGFGVVDGILFDLGVSSFQLDKKDRGFSFTSEKTLDMRMDKSLGVTAGDLVNGLGRKELANLFFKLADERYSRKIAEEIVEARKSGQITTGKQLSELVERVKPKDASKTHPATKVFQALRIAVNDEFFNLETALPQAVNLLKPKARLAVISFHSGEDRIVKNIFKKFEKEGRLKIITKKPTIPSDKEILENPRSRSAKLRIIEKI